MTCGIYKITNKINGKLYIGQSCDIEKRWRDHKNNSNYEYKKNHLYSAIRKYGLDNFTFSIICEVPESVLDVYEISYIKYYETTNPIKGYNKDTGGANGRPTEETKQKISEAQKAKIKQYQYQGNIYNKLQELADFLGITYTNLTTRIHRKQIDVTIIPKVQSEESRTS